jgi:hypothetical protein
MRTARFNRSVLWLTCVDLKPVPATGRGAPPRQRVGFELQYQVCRSEWPRGLTRGSAAARLLELRVRIPPEASVFVSCEFCVLSGRGLCVGPITYPEEPYRVWCV